MRPINKRMKEIRENLEMSQVELAEKTGTTQAYISALELGNIESPSVDKAQKIASILGVTLEYLFPMKDESAA
jgi:transcriptional regulator with XRE-family HTH domain